MSKDAKVAAAPSEDRFPALEVTLQLSGDQVELIARRVAEIMSGPAPAPAPVWVDAAGAAEYIAASRERIYDLVQLGKLEPRRDGRRLLFRVADLDAYLEHAA